MKTFTYFCRKYLFLAAIVLVVAGCTDTIEIEYDRDIIGGNGIGLSVSEAREFFEKSMISQSRAGHEPKDDKYYKDRCMLPVGDFVPQWEEGISTDAPTLFSVDVPIKATYRYRVLRIDEKTQKVYTTTCYQELVVVKDLEGRMGYKVVLFIPDREYSIKNPGDVSRRLTNGIDMGDYSGLKIFTDIEGRMTRVNRFLNGKKTVGIDLTKPETFEERLALYVRALKAIGKISIQRQGTKATMSRGEGDWYDENWDDMWGSWWGDYNDDESDVSNDYYEKVDVLPGEDVYYNHFDGNYYIDFGGDGHVDSCISSEAIITPDEGSQTTPPDDPIEDPEDPYEWGTSTDNSDITDGGENFNNNNNSYVNNKIVSPSELKKAANTAVNYVIQTYDNINNGKRAYCNIGVAKAFETIFNTTELKNMRANDMVKYWQNNPQHWEKIEMVKAQSLANQGFFVVAGYINPNGSGHVVVVVPGEEGYSKNWGGAIPNVMDTGRNMRTESQTINYSFNKSLIPYVEFYKYK